VVDVAKVEEEPLPKCWRDCDWCHWGWRRAPCRSIDEVAVDVAKVEGERLAKVSARLRLMSPRLKTSPLPKCWRGCSWCHRGWGRDPCRRVGEIMVDVTEVEGEHSFTRMLEKVRWSRLGWWRRFLLQNAGEGFVDLVYANDEGSFSKMLEKVLLMLSMLMMKVLSKMLEKVRWSRWSRWQRFLLQNVGKGSLKSSDSMTKVPSPKYWRGFVEVTGVNDEGSFSRMWERVHWSHQSRWRRFLLQNVGDVSLKSSESMTKVPSPKY
jgi:hypothetical protein